MKIVIVRDMNNVVTDDIFLIPSHYGIKKDIYAYNIVGEFLGVVSNKDRNNIKKRDEVTEFYSSNVPSGKSFSLKCKLVEKKDKILTVETVAFNTIDNVSVFKSQPVSVSLLELAHTPSRSNSKTKAKDDIAKCWPVDNVSTFEPEEIETVKPKALKKQNKKIKENNINGVDNMKLGMNFANIFGGEIGMVKSDNVKLGLNGEIAVKRADGDYVTFKEDGTVLNVSQFAFDMGGLFIVPVTIDNVKKGDIVIKDNVYYHVDEDGVSGQGLKATSVNNSEIKEFRLTKSMLLNNEYVRKVISPFSMFGKLDNSNPFMALVMLSGMNMADEKSEMMNTLLMAQMINGGQNGFDMKSMLPLLMFGKSNDGNSLSQYMILSTLTNGGLFGKTEDKTEVVENKAITKEEIKKYVEEVLNSAE